MLKLGLFILCTSLAFQGYFIIRDQKYTVTFNEGLRKLQTLHPTLGDLIKEDYFIQYRVLVGILHVFAFYKLLLNWDSGVILPIFGNIFNLIVISQTLKQPELNTQIAITVSVIGGLIYLLGMKSTKT